MSSVWNLLNPIRNGGTGLKLLNSGRELFGTVIRSGKMDKTVTVKVDHRFWFPKTKEFKTTQSKYQVHDQDNFCVVGDKVVIKHCMPLSELKHYYVRNIVKAFPRDTYYNENEEKKEMSDALKAEYAKLYKDFIAKESQLNDVKNKKDEVAIKSALKAKALTRAMINVRKAENNLKKREVKSRSKSADSASRSSAQQPTLADASNLKLSNEI